MSDLVCCGDPSESESGWGSQKPESRGAGASGCVVALDKANGVGVGPAVGGAVGRGPEEEHRALTQLRALSVPFCP